MSKKIKLIVGSTRQGRIGKPIAEWLVSDAKQKGIDIELLDIAEYNLPFFEAAAPPAMAKTTVPEAMVWAKAIEEADAFVFLTAEYNGGIPAPLKNAIDFLKDEWDDKPAVVVSYGFNGGKDAAGNLRVISNHLNIKAVDTDVSVKLSRDTFDETGGIKDINVTMADTKESFREALSAVALEEVLAI